MKRTWRLMVMLMLMLGLPAGIRAQDKAMLIELQTGALPSGVNPSGSVVVGGLRSGGAFYWMPTTGDIYLGGFDAVESSRDGRTIVGTALDAKKFSRTTFRRKPSFRSASAAASNTSSPAPLACGRTSATNRPCSTTRRPATSAFRSDSVREPCSSSSSPPAP